MYENYDFFPPIYTSINTVISILMDENKDETELSTKKNYN